MISHSNKKCLVLILLFLLIADVALGEELRDPAERDEDISGTQIFVDIELTTDGLYRYAYGLESSKANRGIIAGLNLNLFCDTELPETGLVEPKHFRNTSPDGRHVPAIVTWAEGEVRRVTYVDAHNQAFWLLSIPPGETQDGLILYSTAPPGPVAYRIEPRWSPFGYDIGDYHESYPDHWPTADDFVISGLIDGPACPSGEADDGGSDRQRFAGASPMGGSATANQLLTYSEPTRDRLRMPEGTNRLPMTVHYHERLDPDSFRVQPAWARRYFDPKPGTSQHVELPLRGPVTRFQLEAHAQRSELPRNDDPFHHSIKDVDVFEVRLGEHPGRGRGPDARPVGNVRN